MKALQIVEIGKPLELRLVLDPVAESGQVIVQIAAAGICHSDAHYRDGTSSTGPLPITPGHEIAGRIVEGTRAGERVCLHYLVTCGECDQCMSGREQWCASAQMLGKDRDGGYAEFISVPERNAIRIPDPVSDADAAVMMCSSATSLHAIRKARLREGETVAVFGCGGLGLSAVQIARILGAKQVFGVDLDARKLDLAEKLGATPIDAAQHDAPEAIAELTGGSGVDVALELAGRPMTVSQAIRSVGIQGRVAVAGITNTEVPLNPYTELIGREVEIVGVSDHHVDECEQLLNWAAGGDFDVTSIVTESVSLDADEVNSVLDKLASWEAPPRTVIQPE